MKKANEKIIIGLTSRIGGGKGTAAKYLEEKYGATTYRFSTMLRDVLNRLHLKITRENMQSISTLLRNAFGEDLMAKVIAEDVKKDKNSIIVVEGIRRMADIKYLKNLPHFILIGIDAEPKTRYERIVKRSENAGDSAKTYADFLTEEKAETETQIPEVMKNSKTIINNNGNLEELYKQVDDIIDI